MRMKIISFLLCSFIFGCQNHSNLIHGAKFEYVNSYHCWPYDVEVYSVSNVTIDSLFFSYPSTTFKRGYPKLSLSTWDDYAKLDTIVWYGMEKTLNDCDENNELYQQIINEESVYYSGLYRYVKNLAGNKIRRYEIITFLDLQRMKVHIFKDMNKVY